MINKLNYLKITSIVLGLLVLNLHPLKQLVAQNKSLEEAYYKIKPVYLPPLKRPEVKYSLDQLKFKNTSGQLPTFDGEQFQVNLHAKGLQSKDDAKKMMSQFLESLKISIKVDDQLRMKMASSSAKTDEKYIDEQIKIGNDATLKRLQEQMKNVSKSSTDMISEFGNDIKKQSSNIITVYSFDQYFENTIIDNTSINISVRSQNEIASFYGRFFNNVKSSNKKVLTVSAAITGAIAYLKKQYKVENITGDTKNATVVLLPYKESFKYAWKTQITADGRYRIWIDAETGEILQLLPEFYFDNAKGLVFNPSPTQGTKEMSFEVDPPSGGLYTLKKTGFLTLINNGADGTTGIVSVSDDGSGTANFNISPINGTVVERTNMTGYNGQFQQVNAFAHVYNMIIIYNFLGSQTFNAITITLNTNDACGYGINNACSGGSYMEFGIGSGTTGSSTSCNGVRFNAAIDATIIAHELGHTLNDLQYGFGGGSMTGSINEGLADFWAHTIFDMDVSAGWFAHNCTSPTQGGGSPRQADAADIFPDLFTTGGSTEIHSSGQIIAWGLWNARQGMNDATGLGTLSINFNTIKAMTTSGVGVLLDGTAKSIHDSYQDLLKQMAPLYSSSRLIHKLLAGYARAGIFLTPKDAIIDINDSYLDRNSATGPTFTIWTGEDYTFNTNNSVNTASQPFNTQFLIEIANDEAFSSNLKSSGWLGGVTSGAGGTTTWNLPIADWNTLKAGDAIYYRVTSKDGNGTDMRYSWQPGNNFLGVNVPVGKAAINNTGNKDCSCSAASGSSNSTKALIPLIPIGLLLIFRRKIKKVNFTVGNEKQDN